MAFRETLAAHLPTMDGLTDSEKDPEEFVNALFKEILKPPPLLKLR